MKLRSAYAKMFDLPYKEHKTVDLSGKFLNISCVLYDKSGAVQVDPYKQQHVVESGILDLVAEPTEISVHTAITVLYIAYHGNLKLSSNLNNYVLQWGKSTRHHANSNNWVMLISKLHNPMTFCKILHKYGILKRLFPWLKVGIKKVDEETGNRLCNDAVQKNKYSFLYTYLAVLGDHTKHNIEAPTKIGAYVKFIRVIKNGSKGKDIVSLFKDHNINHYGEDFLHTVVDIAESMRIVEQEYWGTALFRFYDEYYITGYQTKIKCSADRLRYCDEVAKRIYK